MLTHNRFNTDLVLFFSDLNKAQEHKMSCRVSSKEESETFISFDYLNIFTPNQHTAD